jgi:hypothetical protein
MLNNQYHWPEDQRYGPAHLRLWLDTQHCTLCRYVHAYVSEVGG